MTRQRDALKISVTVVHFTSLVLWLLLAKTATVCCIWILNQKSNSIRRIWASATKASISPRRYRMCSNPWERKAIPKQQNCTAWQPIITKGRGLYTIHLELERWTLLQMIRTQTTTGNSTCTGSLNLHQLRFKAIASAITKSTLISTLKRLSTRNTHFTI